MNQENNQTQNMAPRSPKKPGFWKRWFVKRWIFPALYLGAAALIIGLVVAQVKDATNLKEAKPAPDRTGSTGTDAGQLPDSAPAAASQRLIWPVAPDETEAKVTMSFYDPTKDEKTQAASILKYDNNFYTQNGVVIGRKDDKPFTVVAAASGTVTRVETDPLMGQVVEIKHDNGYVTYYASLDQVEVKEGDKVTQGQPIAKSGNNRLEADQKNHLHFEVKKDGKNLNPETEIPH